MEVHTHTHPSTGSGHRKKWTHYFWEFLMLFLAVFCGFLAEYQLEHKIERERAKEYAIQLHNDLTSDSSDFNAETRTMELSIKKLDTLSELLNDFRNSDSASGAIYLLSAFALNDNVFEPITTTMEQLKNSGNLRYLGDSALRNAFSEYDVWVQIIKTRYTKSDVIENEIRKTVTQILNIKEISRLSNSNAPRSTLASLKIKLNTSDLSLLKQYSNWCTLKQKDLNLRMYILRRTQMELRKLIQKLNANFHFN